MALETGASERFVERVRELFAGKGISLDADAAPFETALGDAFCRQAAIQETLAHARRSLGHLRERLVDLGGGFRHHLAELEGLRESLARRAEAASPLYRTLVPGPREPS